MRNLIIQGGSRQTERWLSDSGMVALTQRTDGSGEPEYSVTKVAEKYGVSDVMIHKACKALNVPVPPRGYWAKKQAGQAVETTPLPESNGKTVILGIKNTDTPNVQDLSVPDDGLSFLDEVERASVIAASWKLHISNDGHKLHPVLLKQPRTPLQSEQLVVDY